MPVTLKGAKVKKVAGAGPASAKVALEEVKALANPDKAVIVNLRLPDGRPACVGLRYELKVPGEATPKKGAVPASGRIAYGGLKPGKCELDFVGLDEEG